MALYGLQWAFDGVPREANHHIMRQNGVPFGSGRLSWVRHFAAQVFSRSIDFCPKKCLLNCCQITYSPGLQSHPRTLASSGEALEMAQDLSWKPGTCMQNLTDSDTCAADVPVPRTNDSLPQQGQYEACGLVDQRETMSSLIRYNVAIVPVFRADGPLEISILAIRFVLGRITTSCAASVGSFCSFCCEYVLRKTQRMRKLRQPGEVKHLQQS
jgi:hypothetical protein